MAISLDKCLHYQDSDFSFKLYIDFSKYLDSGKYKNKDNFFIPILSLPTVTDNENDYWNVMIEYGFYYQHDKLIYTEPGIEITIETEIKENLIDWLLQTKSSSITGRAKLKILTNKITKYENIIEFYTREYAQFGESWDNKSKYWLINNVSKFKKEDKYIYQMEYDDSRVVLEIVDIDKYL